MSLMERSYEKTVLVIRKGYIQNWESLPLDSASPFARQKCKLDQLRLAEKTTLAMKSLEHV